MTDHFYGLTDTGKQRQNNEDTFIAQANTDNRYVIACVIDGVGGYSGGEVAAALAREAIIQRLSRLSGEIIPLIIDALHLANDKILKEKEQVKEHNSMACVATLAVIDLQSNQFYYAHVGDTRLYLLRDGSLIKISHDQSFVGFLEESGRITEKEAMNHPKRNEIEKALGFKNSNISTSDYVETGQSPFLPSDTLLLCSDGLTDLVDKESITHIINQNATLKSRCTQLVDAANLNGGKDNITVVMVENNKSPKQHEVTHPAENIQKTFITENTHKMEKVKEVTPPVLATRKSGKWSVAVLSVLVVLLLTVCVWQYINYTTKEPNTPKVTLSQAKKALNAQEIKLQNAIDSCKGKSLLLTDVQYPLPVMISQPININRDTLYIKTKGKIVFQSDTGYHGAAFIISPQAKRIILDSLYIKQFDIGVSGYNTTLELRNVRFVNCIVPLQNAFHFTDNKYVSGSLSSVVFKTDSLPKTK
jgi:serine/threonine protein phosphatase PrpC